MSDDDFLAAFNTCTLPRPDWTHEAHIRLARVLLLRHPFRETIDLVCAGIRRYNESLGNFTGYHETITIAYVHVVASRMVDAETWADFRALNRDLFANGLAVLSRFYSDGVLQSDLARTRFLEPDRVQLPLRE